ncbi:MAG: hypothetical protein ACREPR_15395 [Brasilonema sp.]
MIYQKQSRIFAKGLIIIEFQTSYEIFLPLINNVIGESAIALSGGFRIASHNQSPIKLTQINANNSDFSDISGKEWFYIVLHNYCVAAWLLSP